jgi:proteasome assembly chaperone (PAC2) family protein
MARIYMMKVLAEALDLRAQVEHAEERAKRAEELLDALAVVGEIPKDWRDKTQQEAA